MKDTKIIEDFLKKILTGIYIIIALLAVITIVLFTSNVKITNSDSKEEALTEETTTNEESTDYDVSMFKSVSVDETIDLFDSKKTQVIYIGRSTCGYCVKFLPVLQEAQKKFGYKTNYLDITTVTEDGQSKLLKKDNDEKFLEENFASRHMVLLVKEGKIVEGWVGYAEYDSFAQYLTRNGFEED